MLRQNPNNGGSRHYPEPHRLSEDLDLDDSTCSTPYVSAPSSPGRGGTNSGYFFSAPASPVNYMLSSSARAGRYSSESTFLSTQSSDSSTAEFEFASKFSPNSSVAVGSMSSADELFLNGQIRPMKLSSHLQRPQILAPLIDLDVEEEDDDAENEVVSRGRDLKLRSRSLHRKARSLSPLRTAEFQWNNNDDDEDETVSKNQEQNSRTLEIGDLSEIKSTKSSASTETTPSSSRSSSSGRNSKKWIFLKDLLYRSKSEGRSQSKDKDKFWSTVSFSPSLSKRQTSKEEKPPPPPPQQPPSPPENPQQKRNNNVKKQAGKRPTNGISKRRVPASAHELHYKTNRAQAEEMKKRTFLPYRQGLFGCLGFSSKGYSALSGFTKTLNPVSSR